MHPGAANCTLTSPQPPYIPLRGPEQSLRCWGGGGCPSYVLGRGLAAHLPPPVPERPLCPSGTPSSRRCQNPGNLCWCCARHQGCPFMQRKKILGIPTIPGYQKYNMKSPQRLKPSSSIYQVKQKSFLHTAAESEDACVTRKCKTYLLVLRRRMQNLSCRTPQENARLTFYEDSHTYKCKSEWPAHNN